MKNSLVRNYKNTWTKIINTMNKILYITYDFNFKKTASSRFFYDFLCENYQVETISPDANEIIPYDQINKKNYSCIISFYYMADFSKFTCKNLIFVPMYDGFSYSFKKVLQLKNVKIINFCKYLHKLSKSFGLLSFYIQYFPELSLNDSEERNILFYWQRRELSFSEIANKLPENLNELGVKKTILHSATDGNTKFIRPSEEEINKYNITITDWFENKNELLDLLDKTKYYIAPRMQEGIGLSFLDAMSHGCVIIANNDRTMNEYIKNTKNGYLINYSKNKRIKFHNFQTIQENSIQYFKTGREKYLNTLPALVKFINFDTKDKSYNRLGYIIAFLYFAFKKLCRNKNK